MTVASAASPSFESVAVGDRLPPFAVALTLQRLVMEAGANRDFSPIHFDLAAARESGSPQVYANTTFVETMLEAGVRSWAGPLPRLRRLRFKMLTFSCVGETLTASGEVVAKREGEGDLLVDLDLRINGDPRGETVRANAVLAFPPTPPRPGQAEPV